MFKYIFFAVLLAFATAEPKPEPKPGFIAAPLTTALTYPGAYINPYSPYNSYSAYNAYPYALPYYNNYYGLNRYPYRYANYY